MRKQPPFKVNQKYDSGVRKTNYPSTPNTAYTSRFTNTQSSQARKSSIPTNASRYSYTRPSQQKQSSTFNKRPTQLNESKLQKFKQQSSGGQRQPVFQKRAPTQNFGNYRRAPSNQFKRYLDDSQNVFWQNSWQVRKLKYCKFLRLCLIVLFAILFSTYIGIRGIKPWPQELCPQHAECGVFIHCKRGYIQEDNNCYLDPAIKDRAKQIVTATVQQLKLDYGALDCQSQFMQVPRKRTLKIFQQFKVQDQQLKNQIYNLLEDPQNSVKLKFNYSAFTVTPTEKVHPLTCQIQLFAQTPSFYWLVLGLLICFILIVKLISYLQFLRKASAAYNYLRQKCAESDCILIQEHKGPIRRFAGQWNEQLWQQIDRLRYEQRVIVYFQQNDQLYWKMYKQEEKRQYF